MECTYTFKNGVKFTGTPTQIMQYAKSIDESIDTTKLPLGSVRGFYESSTQGFLSIAEMETPHIVNALTKRTVEYFQAITKPKGKFDLKTYLTKFVALTNDSVIEDLYTELQKRK